MAAAQEAINYKLCMQKAGLTQQTLDQFVCPICYDVNYPSAVTVQCGSCHIMHENCYKAAIEVKPACPLCKKELRGPSLVPLEETIMTRIIKNLSACCPYDCGWLGDVQGVQQHCSDCPANCKKCERCHQSVPLKGLSKHTISCKERLVPCIFMSCAWVGKIDQLSDHANSPAYHWLLPQARHIHNSQKHPGGFHTAFQGQLPAVIDVSNFTWNAGLAPCKSPHVAIGPTTICLAIDKVSVSILNVGNCVFSGKIKIKLAAGGIIFLEETLGLTALFPQSKSSLACNQPLLADHAPIVTMASNTTFDPNLIQQTVAQVDQLITTSDQLLLLAAQSRAREPQIQHLTSRMEAALDTLRLTRLLVTSCTDPETQHAVQQLDQSLSLVETNARQRFHRITEISTQNHSYAAERPTAGDKGRPTAHISEDQLISLRQLNFSWAQIARLLGVSRVTIWQRRKDFQIADPVTVLSDDDLDNIVQEIKRDSPGNIGSSIVTGAVRARGFFVNRTRVYYSLKRTDPIGVAIRRHVHIQRRQYSVPGPNSLWHADTNHKLARRYGIVTHGCIDGFSRCIVFLKASNNNRAQTMLHFFLEATGTWGWPSRLRTDRGSEMVDVGRAMVERRGENRGSHIAGPSVRNQRIERLWSDVRVDVLQGYMNLFDWFEVEGLLDIGDPVSLAALQYVYLPRINHHLHEFSEAWISHPLRGSSNKSPIQLYTEGLLRLYNSNFSCVREIVDETQDWNWYGVDFDITNSGEETHNEDGPEVNEIPAGLPISDTVFQQLCALVNPMDVVEDAGLRLFVTARDFLRDNLRH